MAKRKRDDSVQVARQRVDVLESELFGDASGLDAVRGEELPASALAPPGISAAELEDRLAEAEAAPAWQDEDDEGVRVDVSGVARNRKLRRVAAETVLSGADYEQRLRQQFQVLHHDPAWAKLPSGDAGQASSALDSDDEEAEAVLRRMQSSNAPRQQQRATDGALAPGSVDILRVKDANVQEPSKAVVQSVRFHPNGQLLLTAGYDKTVRLFHVDGTSNSKVQSVHLGNFPIETAEFALGGAEIVAASRRKWFFTLDTESGAVHRVPGIQGRQERSLERFVASPDQRYLAFFGTAGTLMLVSQRTKLWAANLKVGSDVRSAAFAPDGNRIITGAADGTLHHWDLRSTRRCVLRQTDDGTIHNTALAYAGTGAYYATGNDSGVVNVYDAATSLSSSRPKPMRAIMNLTTSIHDLRFSSDAQILAISSRSKKDQMRLVHMPSATVFANWPTPRTPLHHVSSLAFSPNSGYLAIGNDAGRCLLYRLNHYGRA